MFCTGCGNQLPEGANVCPNCGKPIEGAKKVDLGGLKNATSGMPLGKIVALVGAVVALIATFLPFASVSLLGYSTSVSLISSGFWGFLALICAVAAGVLVFLGKDKFPLFALVASAVGALVYIIEIIALKSNEFGSYYKVGIGAWLGIIGFVAAAVGAFLLMKDNK